MSVRLLRSVYEVPAWKVQRFWFGFLTNTLEHAWVRANIAAKVARAMWHVADQWVTALGKSVSPEARKVVIGINRDLQPIGVRLAKIERVLEDTDDTDIHKSAVWGGAVVPLVTGPGVLVQLTSIMNQLRWLTEPPDLVITGVTGVGEIRIRDFETAASQVAWWDRAITSASIGVAEVVRDTIELAKDAAAFAASALRSAKSILDYWPLAVVGIIAIRKSV